MNWDEAETLDRYSADQSHGLGQCSLSATRQTTSVRNKAGHGLTPAKPYELSPLRFVLIDATYVKMQSELFPTLRGAGGGFRWIEKKGRRCLKGQRRSKPKMASCTSGAEEIAERLCVSPLSLNLLQADRERFVTGTTNKPRVSRLLSSSEGAPRDSIRRLSARTALPAQPLGRTDGRWGQTSFQLYARSGRPSSETACAFPPVAHMHKTG